MRLFPPRIRVFLVYYTFRASDIKAGDGSLFFESRRPIMGTDDLFALRVYLETVGAATAGTDSVSVVLHSIQMVGSRRQGETATSFVLLPPGTALPPERTWFGWLLRLGRWLQFWKR